MTSSEHRPHGSPRWSSGGNPEQGEWPSNQHKRPLSASFSEALDYAQQTVNGEIPYEETWFVIADAYISLFEQLEAAQTALAPFAKAGKKLIHQGSQGYRNGTYDDQTETYTFRVGDVIAAYKIAGTSDPGDAPQSSAPQSDEPSGARGAPFPATNASEPVEATQGPSTDGNPSSHPGSEASVPAKRPE